MSSSDSEDDYFGNIAQKLHSMKNNYREDKIETTNLLDDAVEDTASVSQVDLTGNNQASGEDEASKILERLLNESQAKKGRITRSKARQNAEIINEVLQENTSSLNSVDPPRARRRGGGRQSNQQESTENSVNTQTRRGRTGKPNRRGSRRSRGRGGWNQCVPDHIDDITYSVGNTYEYPDQSYNQELFSMPSATNSGTSADDTILIDDEIVEDNEELSVKVYWQNSEYFKFTIRKYQKLSQIFDFFAQKENVNHDKLLFMYNEKIFTPNDTPDSINYNFVKFIHGGIVNQSITSLSNEGTVKNGIKIKFQCQNVKKPFETTISLDDKMSLAMLKCAEHLEMPLDNLIFEFDGDCMSGKNTARELELESGECIDVKIMR